VRAYFKKYIDCINLEFTAEYNKLALKDTDKETNLKIKSIDSKGDGVVVVLSHKENSQ
jgi:hypothetical protein